MIYLINLTTFPKTYPAAKISYHHVDYDDGGMVMDIKEMMGRLWSEC